MTRPIILGIASLMMVTLACSSSRRGTDDTTAQNTGGTTVTADTVTTMEGLRFVEGRIGTGEQIRAGMRVTVDYAGYLIDGRLFDTSIDSVGRSRGFDRGGYPFEPIEFTVGRGEVIQGWDIGLTNGMRVGGKRRLIIPPALGYGQYGSGHVIPPNATLVFDVEVLRAE